jgi:hypothetical protein
MRAIQSTASAGRPRVVPEQVGLRLRKTDKTLAK